MSNSQLNLSSPVILEELWQCATFDHSVYKLLEQYTAAQESGELTKDTPAMRQLAQDIYHHLTTTRNRNLITDQEQQILRQAVGGFFGMSTGSHAVTSWIMESRADTVKIIDPDQISPSNLNRMRFGWDTIGQNKVDAVAAEINRLSPYTTVIKTIQTDSDTTHNLFTAKPSLNFIVEAIDDLKAKVELRLLAKQYRLPFIMSTDVGDNVFIDIERYDLTPQPQLFNNRVPGIEAVDFDHLSQQDKIQISMKIVGFESNSIPMLSSLHSIGKKIGTWPQLGATAAMAGAISTTIIKKILLGEMVKSGRYYVSLDDILVADFNSPSNQQSKELWIKKIHQRFGDDK